MSRDLLFTELIGKNRKEFSAASQTIKVHNLFIENIINTIAL